MKVQYLEIVTPEVDTVCATYAQIYDVKFSDADVNLGGARTAKLSNGGVIGVRGPLRETEEPVVRHYTLVKDIEAAVNAARWVLKLQFHQWSYHVTECVPLSFKVVLSSVFGNCSCRLTKKFKI
ncbi:hypothetical protein L0991_05960 [Vibrio chagasii]